MFELTNNKCVSFQDIIYLHSFDNHQTCMSVNLTPTYMDILQLQSNLHAVFNVFWEHL